MNVAIAPNFCVFILNHHRSGTYKLASILASLCAMLCFTLLAIFWSGEISPVYALFIFPGGFATGIAHSAAFVGVTAGVEEDETAIAGGGLYTMSSIGGVVGLAGTDSLFRFFLQTSLARALKDIPKGSKVSLSAAIAVHMVL